METIRIAVADDHNLFRKGLVSLIEMEDDFEVVLEAANGLDLVRRLEATRPHVILMDIRMPEMDGLEATAKIREDHPDINVLVITSHDDDELILTAVNNGAKGYLLKEADPDEVVMAIHSIRENGFYFKEDVSRLLLKGIVDKNLLQSKFDARELLTQRETEVLQLICEELTNAEIADKLCLSPRTVEGYRQNMLEKIGARNTAGLVIFALKNKLVEID